MVDLKTTGLVLAAVADLLGGIAEALADFGEKLELTEKTD